MYFEDRVDAGRRLAQSLRERGYTGERTLVLALPRGGVPVAFEVATALDAPLDVWVVRKVGVPGYEELGLGAVAEGGVAFVNRRLTDEMGVTEVDLQSLIRQKTDEVKARVARFRQGAGAPRIEGQRVILVDDGIATGGTVRAALQALRMLRPSSIILAVPVAASQTLDELAPLADDVVCVLSTPSLYAIGQWYADFRQVPDEVVATLLARARLTRGYDRHTPPGGTAHT